MTTPRPTIWSGALRATTSGMLIIVTMIAFEAMAVSAALPTAARDLHGIAAYGWAFTGFLVANVVGMVLSGQLSDAHGPRLPLAAGVLLFAVGLLVAGLAPTMPVLISGRIVQGLASGLLITALYVVMGTAYSETVRPKLFAAISSAWVLPSLLGPVLSGTLTEQISWRWVFLGLVPFVAVGAVLLLPVLRTMPARDDRGGALADRRRIGYALAVAVGVAALEQAGQHPSALWYGLAVPGVGLLLWGLRTLLPAGTFTARPGVAAPIALRGLFAGAFFGVETIIPLALTVQHHYDPTEAGLPLACSGVTWAIGSWWQGRHVEGDGPLRRARLVRVGFVCVAVAAGLVAVAVHPGAPAVLIYPAWALAGLGAGLTMSSVAVLMLSYTNDADRGSDSAALQLSDATSSALTTGYGGVLVAAAAAGSIGYTGAFTALCLTMAAVSGLGAAIADRARAAAPVSRSEVPAALRT
ncbi:MAG: hypothetical protein QOE97_198 [Pseudonocardiales bacterium]|nr:hypothetical protein [Pseudonocardiales bacterium]